MKLAIPASGPTLDDQVDNRFARAPYIIFINPEDGETSSLANPYAHEGGGVGPRVVQLLVQNQVTHLIAPRIGGHAETALLATGITVFMWEGSGSVSSAIELYKAGKLTVLSQTS